MIHSTVSAADVSQPCRSVSEALHEELENAYDEVSRCTAELDAILDLPRMDRSRLTTVRLKIARLRLARGPLVSKVTAYLVGKVSSSEAALLHELRVGHEEMLRVASSHTSMWTLDAIEKDWPKYKADTRQISKFWMQKLKSEQDFICRLIRRSTPSGRGR